MNFKTGHSDKNDENIKNTIKLEYRLFFAKKFFVYIGFLFFLNFFFVGAKFHDNIFTETLTFTYIAFVLSLCFFIYFFLCKQFKKIKIMPMVLAVLLFLLFLFFLLPLY